MLLNLYVLCVWLLTLVTQCGAHVLNYDSVTICDGMEKVVRCPNKENIHVLQGFFGKWKNHDCNGIKMDPSGTQTCSQNRKETTRTVRSTCQGKNQCTFAADKQVYGNPCPNSSPYLYITFFCMAPGKKIVHQRDKDNHEVVTVLTHGFLVSERKFTAEPTPEKNTADMISSQEVAENTDTNSIPTAEATTTSSEEKSKITIPNTQTSVEENVKETSSAVDVANSAGAGVSDAAPVASDTTTSAVDRNLIPTQNKLNQSEGLAGEKNLSVSVCNGERHAISCKRDVGMLILSAFYGKNNGQDCRGDLGYRDDIPDCFNPRALDSVKFLCENRKSCELASEKELFGDDVCPGVNKYLQVTYQC